VSDVDENEKQSPSQPANSRRRDIHHVGPTSNVVRHSPLGTHAEHVTLSLELSQLRQSLDTVQQALQIEQSGQRDELKILIAKWRGVAQEAADELFADAKDKIDGMGGFAAWQQQSDDDSRRWQGDDHDHHALRKNRSDPDDGLSSSEAEEDEQSVSRGW
jgi:Swi5-dependent recombination DNA repair protein 1